MTLEEQYATQYNWRAWNDVYSVLPDLNKKSVLDLGCAIGDQSKDFSDMGAFVTGVDNNPDLLSVAHNRGISNAKFINADFSKLEQFKEENFDFIWSSFSIAYFTDQKSIIQYWKRYLKDDGFLCLVEMSDLLNHQPISNSFREKILKFYNDAYVAKKYDFFAGSKMEDNLSACGFKIVISDELKDHELSFNGFASDDVYDAWNSRFERMPALKKSLGDDFISQFLLSMTKKEHKSNCVVHFVLAQKLS